MAIITLLVLLLMFITPTISMMAVMLREVKTKLPGTARRPYTSVIMVFLSVGLHLLGVRGISAAYLTLSGGAILITMLISTIVTLLLGVALGLLVQDLRRPKP